MERFSILPTLVILSSAVLYGGEPTAAQLEFFESKVRPILVERCQSCHSQAKKTKGGLTLDRRESILSGGDSGPAVVPGNVAQSLLLKAVKYQGLEMPPKGKLPAGEIVVLEKWVEMGAVWPATTEKSGALATKSVLTPERLNHWAFQPFKVSPPESSLDRFVMKRLASEGLKPSSPADRSTLIRRAYLDLTGLPPTPEEVEAFVADDSTDAYAKCVDRLLADPHYGERWGRHWLDVARYSDGHGSFLDPEPLPGAWRYRDWVVKSLNNDMPYDQFVTLQIAGDLIGDGKDGAVATGFLAVGPTYQSDGGDPESIAKSRAETLDDRVDTVTRGFLGLTVSCARCHDHKFDPIPQADYYGLAAVFNNTKNVDQPTGPPDVLKKAEEHRKAVEAATTAIRAFKDKNPAKRKDLEAELAGLKAKAPPTPPKVHAVADAGSADMHLALRGDPLKPGPLVPRRFLQSLAGPNSPAWKQGSGRMQLAEAIANASNPLTARVIVNRVWQQHFGRALVVTSSNFGLLGEKPSHPELLDWLAARFVADGWSLKKLHRLIMLSETYRQSSQYDAAKFQVDGDNRYLWRFTPRRLDVEAWRDSMLAVTGELDRTMGGESVPDILTSKRRTLYAATSRNGDKLPADDFLRLFDFPSVRATVSERTTSTVPQQSLFLLNSPFIIARGKALTVRLNREVKSTNERITRLHSLLFGRTPSPEEMTLAIKFLSSGPEAETLPRYAQALLSSHEFMQIR